MHRPAAAPARILPVVAAMGLALSGGACGSPWPILAQHDDPWFNVARAPAAGFTFTDQPIFDSIAAKAGHHAATVAALDNGELLAAWYSYQGPHELDGSSIWMARRTGGGQWSEPSLHIDRPQSEGNPVLYTEGKRIWLFQAVAPIGWFSSRIEFQWSDDAAGSWSEPISITGPIGANVRFPPIRTADGLLLPAYDDLWQQALFFASEDGMAWRLRSRLATAGPGACIQPSVAVLGDGRLLAVMRNRESGWLWASTSDDGGLNWLQPTDAGFANPDAPAALLSLRDGRLLLVYNDHPSQRRNLSITTSTDDGHTWASPVVITSGLPDEASYPGVTQGPDGNVHIVYSQGRQRIRHVELVPADWSATPD